MNQAIPDITADVLARQLTTKAIGRSLLTLDSTESTNLTAVELASTSLHGLVVVADHQTGGRGRNGRAWFSPPQRNLYFSILLKPPSPPAIVPQLSIVAALSMHTALLSLFPQLPVAVKWPNDIWIDGRKACGILCTMSAIGNTTEYAVLGLGLNINTTLDELPPELHGTATSLCIASGHPCDRCQVLATFLNTFEQDYTQWLAAASLAPFMPRWSQASLLDGHPVTAEHGHAIIAGTARGITPEGQLRLETNGTITLISAGDVARLRL
ncbi:MAG: biotin--[Victivallales bacterium]|nr:biotin--[acetyl-CoA-carboxylase] ligase [Victivallales bacterium]